MTIEALIAEVVAAWRSSDALRAAALFAPDGSYVESNGCAVRGRQALIAHFTQFFRNGPQWRIEIEAIVGDAMQAAVRYRFGLRQTSGAWEDRDGCAWVRREEGLIAEWREYHG